MTTNVTSALCLGGFLMAITARLFAQSPIGQEIAIPRHLAESEEFAMPVRDLVEQSSASIRSIAQAVVTSPPRSTPSRR